MPKREWLCRAIVCFAISRHQMEIMFTLWYCVLKEMKNKPILWKSYDINYFLTLGKTLFKKKNNILALQTLFFMSSLAARAEIVSSTSLCLTFLTSCFIPPIPSHFHLIVTWGIILTLDNKFRSFLQSSFTICIHFQLFLKEHTNSNRRVTPKVWSGLTSLLAIWKNKKTPP